MGQQAFKMRPGRGGRIDDGTREGRPNLAHIEASRRFRADRKAGRGPFAPGGVLAVNPHHRRDRDGYRTFPAGYLDWHMQNRRDQRRWPRDVIRTPPDRRHIKTPPRGRRPPPASSPPIASPPPTAPAASPAASPPVSDLSSGERGRGTIKYGLPTSPKKPAAPAAAPAAAAGTAAGRAAAAVAAATSMAPSTPGGRRARRRPRPCRPQASRRGRSLYRAKARRPHLIRHNIRDDGRSPRQRCKDGASPSPSSTPPPAARPCRPAATSPATTPAPMSF